MRRIIILFIFSLGCANSFAQEVSIKGGVNFSNLYVSEVDDENMKVGFHAGVSYATKLVSVLYLQPEFLYSLKGAEVGYKAFLGLGNDGVYRYNLGYFEVPVLLKAKLQNLHITAGPYVALLLHANIKNVDENGNIRDIEDLERDDFETIDYGISGGLGFDWEGGSIGLRYNKGLQNLAKEGEFADVALKDAKNSVLQLSVAFTL